jgi:hypothetical protein
VGVGRWKAFDDNQLNHGPVNRMFELSVDANVCHGVWPPSVAFNLESSPVFGDKVLKESRINNGIQHMLDAAHSAIFTGSQRSLMTVHLVQPHSSGELPADVQKAMIYVNEPALVTLNTAGATEETVISTVEAVLSSTHGESSVVLALGLSQSGFMKLCQTVCRLRPAMNVDVVAGVARVFATVRSITVPPMRIPPTLWRE